MDVESRLDRALERGGQALRPDVPAALLDVRRQARRRTTRRRVVAVSAAAAGVLAVAVLLQVVTAPGANRGENPVSPPRKVDGVSESVSLSVVNERSASSLGLERVLNVALAPDGHVYVTDASQQVAELSPDLDLVRTWGGPGTGPGEFRLVQGSITVGGDDRVYVSDTGNFRVQVFTPEGRYLRSFGEFGTGSGQFTWPFDLAVDASGYAYVADDKQETLTKLTQSGEQVWRLGGAGEADERLIGHLHPTGFDQAGRLVTTNDDGGVVLFVRPDGTIAQTLGTAPADRGIESFTAGGLFPEGACNATVDQSGLVFVTGCQDVGVPNWVGMFEPATGTRVGEWAGSPLAAAPRWGREGRGYAVTVDGGVAEVAVVGD